MLLIVNYHYFRNPEDSIFPGIHGVNAERFENQISFLTQHFEMLVPEKFVQQKMSDFTQGKYCMITFDDGLKEQYEVAKPILDKYKTQGIYFINGINSKEQKVSLVHKIHWLRSICTTPDFLKSLYQVITEEGIAIPIKFEDFEPVPGQNIYDEPEVRYTKYLLNHVLTDSDQYKIIDKLYLQTGRSEEEHSGDFYFDKSIIKDLGQQRMIGSHGYRHDVKTNLDKASLIDDIQTNQDYIQSISGYAPSMVSYPYGGKKAVSIDVAETCIQLGLKKGFTMERAVNIGLENEMLICRLDANDIPFGKNPLVEINDEIKIDKPATLGSFWF